MRIRAVCALLTAACALGLPQAHAEKSKVSALLNQLDPVATAEAPPGAPGAADLFESRSLMRIEDGHVYIDALASGSTSALLNDLRGLGLKDGEMYLTMVSGRLPLDSIRDMAQLESLRQAWPVMVTTHGAPSDRGLVVSQGDVAQQSDLVKSLGNITGNGVMVGTLSDSFDCAAAPATTAADDVANGDLPEGILVLDDSLCAGGPGSGIDEGRAMMQIIHDVAPGTTQAFHTAFNGQADFANGILELLDAGARIIVDDIIYFAEPMFQDGVISQAANAVFRNNGLYFSSAGNNARDAWEAPEGFQGAGITGVFGGERHDFDPGPDVADLQRIDLAGPTSILFSFQWDDPAASVSGPRAADTDVDVIFYLDPEGTIPIFQISGLNFNIGGDPIEIFGFFYSGADPTSLYMGVELFAGPAPEYMKYVYFESGPSDVATFSFPTFTGSLYGHANANAVFSVGAAAWFRTPYFLPAIFPLPSHNGFTSAGPTPILFSIYGTRPRPRIRNKPEATAPDGGDNTFFGSDIPASFGVPGEPSGFPNFFGTSAAAPHAAAVGALLLEIDHTLTPTRLENQLKFNTIDMDDRGTEGFDTGFDFRTGYGFIQAGEAALSVAKAGFNKYRVCVDGEQRIFRLDNLLEAIEAGGKLGRCPPGGADPE